MNIRYTIQIMKMRSTIYIYFAVLVQAELFDVNEEFDHVFSTRINHDSRLACADNINISST